MANYPTPPDRRIAYDQDDTQVTYWNDGVSGVVEADASDLAKINGEADDSLNIVVTTATPGPWYLAFLFSQAVQLLDARVIIDTIGATVDCEYSDDTTNGRDGSWSQQAAGITHSEMSGGVIPEYRNNIAAIGAASGHVGWRFKFNAGTESSVRLRCIHLYADEHGPTNRLAFWDPILNVELASDFDFGDLARGASLTKTFRIKNLSGSLTANSIVLAVEAGPSHGSPGTWTLLSTDDSAYAQSINIGALGPGTLSGVLYLKSSPPTNAELNTLSTRIDPAVGSWT